MSPQTAKRRSPIATGVLLALTAAIAFGVTTPVVAWAGHRVGAFTTAALLYAGASAAALIARLFAGSQAPLRRSDFGRVLLVAIAGGAVAPTLLAWGLQRSGATLGALLLNLEAVFTVLLARAVYREPIGSRVALALGAMVLGGAALTLDVSRGASWGLLGVLAVIGATAAWATDNTLTRPLAERDPLDVVAAKGAIGAAITGVIALAIGEQRPVLLPLLALLACGATGYGLSLRLYLLAQRRIGAGRTGSVFALAPFIGAGIAYALGDRNAGAWTVAAAMLFGVGVYLHATEHHRHSHTHDPVDHDHVHRHDDGHHTHTHNPPIVGEHAHAHHHEQTEHAHDHAPDIHHGHSH
jgi:drug/metabolite transporter (DMT)-like permease